MSDITELFARDPCGLTDDEIDEIIVHMRNHQAQFELGAKPPKAAKAPKANKSDQLLKDLGLD